MHLGFKGLSCVFFCLLGCRVQVRQRHVAQNRPQQNCRSSTLRGLKALERVDQDMYSSKPSSHKGWPESCLGENRRDPKLWNALYRKPSRTQRALLKPCYEPCRALYTPYRALYKPCHDAKNPSRPWTDYNPRYSSKVL